MNIYFPHARIVPQPDPRLTQKANNRVEKFITSIQERVQRGEYLGGYTVNDWRAMASFIEKKLIASPRKAHLYLRKEKTELPCTIEYQPSKKRTFIHLKTHQGVPLIGEGGQKRVTKTIEYSPQAEVYANAIYTCKNKFDKMIARSEILALRKLQGKKGIVSIAAVSSHRSKLLKKIKKQQVLTKLYNKGDLSSVLRQQIIFGSHLSVLDKKSIAEGILQGVASMHNAGIIHRDIKPENIFVEQDKNNVYRAVVADLGCTTKAGKSKLRVAHCTPGYTPPFAEQPWKIKRSEQKRVDIFPVASTLLFLFAERKLELHGETQKENTQKLKEHISEIRVAITKMQDIQRLINKNHKVLPEGVQQGNIDRKKVETNFRAMQKINQLIIDMLETGLPGKIKKSQRNINTYLKRLLKIKVI